MRKFFRLIFLLIFLLVCLVIFIFIKSPGKAIPISGDHPKSISCIEKLQIGGIEQNLIIRSVDSSKAVLLFLHGGPGFSGYHFINDNDNNLEEEFVLAYWEQRGAGKSYSSSIPQSSMTVNQFVEDAKEITEYLQNRFNQEKVYLLGHSWGAFIGVNIIHKYPELFHSYIGIGQIANQYQSEKLSLEWIKTEAVKRKDEEVLNQLKNLEFPDSLASGKTWLEYMDVQRLMVGKYGGSISAGKELEILSIYKDIIFDLPEYTVLEKYNILNGNAFGLSNLQDDVVQANFLSSIDSLEVPLFFLHGKHDHLVEYSIAKAFYSKVKAPQKNFYTFEHSAHRPFYDETEKFNEIIESIIR